MVSLHSSNRNCHHATAFGELVAAAAAARQGTGANAVIDTGAEDAVVDAAAAARQGTGANDAVIDTGAEDAVVDAAAAARKGVGANDAVIDTGAEDAVDAAAAVARQDTGANDAVIDTGAQDAEDHLKVALQRAVVFSVDFDEIDDDDDVDAGADKATALAAAAPAPATVRRGVEGLAGADRSGEGGWGLPLEVGGSRIEDSRARRGKKKDIPPS